MIDATDPIPPQQPDAASRARITANVTKMQAQHASDDEIETYLRDIEGLKPVTQVPISPARASAKAYAAGPTTDEELGDQPGVGSKVLGTIAATGRHIYGAEPLQAAARAYAPLLFPNVMTGGPQSYSAARENIRGAEDAAPAWARVPAEVAGGTLAAMATPSAALRIAGRTLLSAPVVQGAAYGAAGGLAQSDPNVGLMDRAKAAAISGTLGGLGAKVGDVLGTATRGYLARDLGSNAIARKTAMGAADQAAYGAAGKEGAVASQQATPPEITAALQAPDIAPYADVVRSSRQFANADDYTVLRESYKLMSERSGMLKNRMFNANDFKAGTNLEAGDVRLAKQQMLGAADTPISSRPPIETAQSPAPDVRTAIGRMQDQSGAVAARTPETGTVWNRNAQLTTPAQQQAVSALDRHAAERVVSPSLQGSPANTEQFAPAMPSWRAAVEQHARMAQGTDAFNEGADATRRILGGSQIAAKKLTTKSPAAFEDYIAQLSPENAKAATEGTLGRLRDNMGFSLDPRLSTLFGLTKAFGGGQSLLNAAKVAPYLQQLDAQSGSQFGARMRALGITFGGSAYQP